MSSIRPLATITILAAMGIFLYLKINEGPSSATSPMPAEWEEAPKFEFGSPSTSSAPAAEGAPPAFAPSTSAPSFETPAPAPAFESAPPASAPPATTPPTSAAPPLPELPPISAAPVDSAPPSDSSAATPPVTEPAPLTAATPAAATTTESAPGLPPIPELPPLPSASAAGEMPGPVAPAPPELADPTTPAAATTPTASPFATARPAIDAALSQGELARAHLLLSEWYNDPALSPAEKEEVQTLLNQLAGSVIYSNEHRLEPAYTVQAGETLETIAEKHHVPWQLLAKINGIPSATALQPGQQVKVVRGPFMGVVDVSDGELTLTIDGRFAGKFPVQLDGAATGEGEWTVEQKQLEPTTGPAATDRRLVLRNDEQASATVLITTGNAPSTGGTPPLGTIRIAQQQAEDLYDILSVGSRVVIRR